MTPDEARTKARERVQLEMRAIVLATIAAPRVTLPDAFDQHFDRALDLYGRVEAAIAAVEWTPRGSSGGARLRFAAAVAELEGADGRTG